MREYFHFLQTQFPWLMRFTAFYMGACVGSFLNVCILRIPLGKSIVTPGSHCSCGKPIAWYDNIPIFSWFILRGRARCCGARFSFRYPLIEATTAGVFLWLWISLPPAQAIAGMAFFALLLLGAMIDLDHLQLPDVTTIGGLFAGLGFSLLWPQIHGLPVANWTWAEASHSAVIALTGVAAGAGAIYWLGEIGSYLMRRPAMGYGDMLLMGCIGAFCGWRGTVAAMVGGAFTGLIAIVVMKAVLSMRASKAPPAAPAGEAPAEEAEEFPANDLGRRLFVVHYIPVVTAMIGGLAWMWLERGTELVWPAVVFLSLILILALVQRGKLRLAELWLLLAVMGGVILSSLLPRMHGIHPVGQWLFDALPGATESAIGVFLGAGAALWLLEFANIFRLIFIPHAASAQVMDEFSQIWGEGYLLLFAAVGAFCGWRAALVSLAVFAVAGALVGASRFLGATRTTPAAPRSESPNPSRDPTATAPTWELGQEIPFGPWLAVGGFLYYAWPLFHHGLDRNLDILRALVTGEMPGS